MIRLARDPSAAGGGDAELQTDVMRFFAILAICVIALTSLVETVDRETANPPQPASAPEQSPPAAPRPEPRNTEAERSVPSASPNDSPASSGESRKDRARTEPVPAAESAPRRDPPLERAPESAENTALPPSAGGPGPSLRFASPEALLRLVSSGQVRVFAAVSGRGYRLARDGRRFVPESLPPALYLMAPDTIPEGLSRALSRDAGGLADATWGVTLSEPIRRRLSRAVDAGADGLLLIDAAGRIAPPGGDA